MGGTLAGNALSLAAARATLGEVLTDEAFAAHDRAARALRRRASEAAIAEHGLPWSIVSAGRALRVPLLRPSRRAPARSRRRRAIRTLDEYLHLYLLNRGVLITPFHNMALMCPATTEDQVDRHTEVFAEAVAELAA